MSYHTTVREVYRDAALQPAENLCCVPQAPMMLPGLSIPDSMFEMNYGCGTTVHLQDMRNDQTILYVGVGGGLEALQLAYFARRPGGVIAVDPVREMREAARKNLQLACEDNDWFDASFVEIRDGDALSLPVEDESVGLAAQNCLFNIFKTGGDLELALGEMHRVIEPRGKLAMSDPISPVEIPPHLVEDERLRAACISGCLKMDAYLQSIVEAGFGAIEVRSRKPYRALDSGSHALPNDIMLETIEVAALKTPLAEDGPCIFTGKTATYVGSEEDFDDGRGHCLPKNLPQPICDKTAAALKQLGRSDLLVTDSTWHYQGGGCC